MMNEIPQQTGIYDQMSFQDMIGKFTELHFKTDGVHKGMVPVKKKTDGYDGGKDMKLVFFTKPENLGERIAKIRFDLDSDYYISANSFTKGNNTLEAAFTCHNLVVDIDCHQADGMAPSELKHGLDHLVFCIEQDFCHDYGIPVPNTAVYTGRGLQLWWALEPISAKCKKMYGYVANFLVDRLTRALGDYKDDFAFLQVDKAASGRIAQLYRLPMTKNQATGTFGTVTFIHDRRLDLQAACNDAHEYRQDDIPKFMRRFTSGDPKGTSEHRCSALFELLRMRLEEGRNINGYRDNFLFCLYNSEITAYDDPEVMEQVAKMNSMFPSPLPEHEYLTYLKTSRRKAAANDPYLLKNTSIIGRLDITAEEQRHIRIFAAASEATLDRRNAAKEKKVSRDSQILALAKEGKNKKEIAQAVSCSEGTVANVLKKNGKKTQKEKRHRSACLAIIRGKAIKVIADKTGYSFQYIRNLVKQIAQKGYDAVVGKKHTPPAPSIKRRKRRSGQAATCTAVMEQDTAAAHDPPDPFWWDYIIRSVQGLPDFSCFDPAYGFPDGLPPQTWKQNAKNVLYMDILNP